MGLPLFTYISLDGNLYPVSADTYSQKWTRAFSSQLAGNIVRLNFIDRGPGIRVYDMGLILKTWESTSLPYKNGITAPWDTQLQNLENSYSQIAKVLSFQDPFGRSAGAVANFGVFFTNLTEIIPKYATNNQVIVLAQIELTAATQLVN